MKRWKRIFRNVAVVFLSTGTILSVPVIACAHVEETAEEAHAEQEGNLGNTTLQSEKEETVPEQKAGSEEEQTGENQKKDVNAFSTAGNGQVQDSIGDSSTKEFYTIKTKNNNTYYLVFIKPNLSYPYLKTLLAIISEFSNGNIKKNNNFNSILLEHGKLIIKNNAIKKCISTFLKNDTANF